MALQVDTHVSGSVVYQVTDEDLPKSNIFCELPYCSSDSRRFVYMRRNPSIELNATEYVTVEFGTWETRVIGRGLGDWEFQSQDGWVGGPAMSVNGTLFYRRQKPGRQELVRVDLATLESTVVFELPEDFKPRGNATVSADERFICYGVTMSWDPQMFGIELLDLHTGAREILVEDPHICNPHTQFDPTHGRRIMVQHNRGCRFTADGVLEALVGPEGATLFVVDVPSGRIKRLDVGLPHTNPITGHEAWIANSDEILLSVCSEPPYEAGDGNLIGLRLNGERRVVSAGYYFNHVGTSPCGRYFWADDFQGTSVLLIGCTESGKTAEVCEARTSMRYPQATHAHPWCSPDMRWMVFNSDRTGRTQIYAVRIPESVVESVT
jgi:hypothetical protein